MMRLVPCRLVSLLAQRKLKQNQDKTQTKSVKIRCASVGNTVSIVVTKLLWFSTQARSEVTHGKTTWVKVLEEKRTWVKGTNYSGFLKTWNN